VDKVPATTEYKLLQLRQYLSGEALKVVEPLGKTAAAYETAKERLKRQTMRQTASDCFAYRRISEI